MFQFSQIGFLTPFVDYHCTANSKILSLGGRLQAAVRCSSVVGRHKLSPNMKFSGKIRWVSVGGKKPEPNVYPTAAVPRLLQKKNIN